MFLIKQNIKWWDDWLVISQHIIFFISNVFVNRITRVLWNKSFFFSIRAGFTMIAVIPIFKLQSYCDTSYSRGVVNQIWILKKSNDLLENIKHMSLSSCRLSHLIPFGKVEVISSKILRSPLWLGWRLWNICVTNDHGYVSLESTPLSVPHSRFITGFETRLTRPVPPVKQELATLPEHQSSPQVLVGCVLLDLQF